VYTQKDRHNDYENDDRDGLDPLVSARSLNPPYWFVLCEPLHQHRASFGLLFLGHVLNALKQHSPKLGFAYRSLWDGRDG
jgi:hypothetical protein